MTSNNGILEGAGLSLFQWESAPELPSRTGQCMSATCSPFLSRPALTCEGGILGQSNLSGDTFSIEAPQNLLRTKEYSKNISFGKEFPFKSGSKLLRTFFWCLYRKGVAIHAYLSDWGALPPEKGNPCTFQNPPSENPLSATYQPFSS